MSAIIRHAVLVLVGLCAALALLLVGIRPLLARPNTLIMEVADRSGLFLVDANRAMTIRLARGRVESPVWSPDGTRLAFLRGRPNSATGSSLFIMNADGTDLRELLPAGLNAEYEPPAWSPDSQQLTFVMRESAEGAYYNIYVVNADGTNLRRLTHNLTEESTPVWSPDGTQIAFALHRRNGRLFNPNIFVMDANCDQLPGGCYRNMRQLTSLMAARFPRWSPDGRQIAFVGGQFESLYVMNADGSQPRSVIRREGLMWFHWSPDSRQIVLASSVAVRIWRLSVVNLETGAVHQIESERNAVAPAWSPDGSQIAFLGVDNRRFNIYLTDATGSSLRQITGRETDGLRFAWSPR